MQVCTLSYLVPVLQEHQVSIRGPLIFLMLPSQPQIRLPVAEVDDLARSDHRRFNWFRYIEARITDGSEEGLKEVNWRLRTGHRTEKVRGRGCKAGVTCEIGSGGRKELYDDPVVHAGRPTLCVTHIHAGTTTGGRSRLDDLLFTGHRPLSFREGEDST